MILIAIADDHPMVLQGLSFMLGSKQELSIQATYTSGRALLAGLQRNQPDVLLLDVLFPDYSAEELLPKIVRDYPSIRILAITSVSNLPRVRNLIRLGCLGYLLKNENEATVVRAIQSVYRGVPFLSEQLKQQIDQDRFNVKKVLPINGHLLTRREKEILQLIAKGYTSKEITGKLCISLNTVETHRKNLFQKMDVKNTVTLLQRATTLGLIE